MDFQCKKCEEPIQGMAKVGPEKDGLYHAECHNETVIENYVDQAMTKYKDKVLEYRNGHTSLIGLFMGEVMRLSKGEADPKMTTEILKKKLNTNT